MGQSWGGGGGRGLARIVEVEGKVERGESIYSQQVLCVRLGAQQRRCCPLGFGWLVPCQLPPLSFRGSAAGPRGRGNGRQSVSAAATVASTNPSPPTTATRAPSPAIPRTAPRLSAGVTHHVRYHRAEVVDNNHQHVRGVAGRGRRRHAQQKGHHSGAEGRHRHVSQCGCPVRRVKCCPCRAARPKRASECYCCRSSDSWSDERCNYAAAAAAAQASHENQSKTEVGRACGCVML